MRALRTFLAPLLASLSLLATGCVTDQVRSLGAAELECPASQVEVVGGSGSYVARGCGRAVVYDCAVHDQFPEYHAICMAHRRPEVIRVPAAESGNRPEAAAETPGAQ